MLAAPPPPSGGVLLRHMSYGLMANVKFGIILLKETHMGVAQAFIGPLKIPNC